MKPTKIRNLQLYQAPYHVLSKQLGSHLSKDLRQKYGTRSIRVTIGDTVRVLRGEFKGVDGKVKEVNTLKRAVTIEGIKKEEIKLKEETKPKAVEEKQKAPQTEPKPKQGAKAKPATKTPKVPKAKAAPKKPKKELKEKKDEK